mmetsp:Transcript_261/g.440  ORF Transcript_261/g.440 Transcript_261/m.440 type:complete len:444 (+) Transcript_261:216-1547(+)|eukprot:CAMPEP_0184525810 /NCGR_PEP_ID=MMETSP0198_2-20121128/10311_1 /TAXON_ID=1112570 /ORGANISM="Thraustochytrium sp., Strain LLF1b" /LENGTH=443 /DNA_ID=CAMNT_0026917323 /DNA_START=150 /DNA_END=1481 /DNA_ORIENTATION=+
MGNFVTSSPNTAVIKSGLFGTRVKVGQTVFRLWVLEQVKLLNLDLLKIEVESTGAETLKGVRVRVKAVAQVKVKAWDTIDGKRKLDVAHITLAAQHFLDDKRDAIMNQLRSTLEGHQRQILGTLTVENLYKGREEFSDKVKSQVVDDLLNMGFEVASYVVQQVDDDNGYMLSLGVTRTAQVKREAAEGKSKNEAEARKEVARINAEADKLESEARMKAHIAVNEQLEAQAESDRDLKMKTAKFDAEVNRAQAEAMSAKPIEEARQTQSIVREEAKQTKVEEEVNLNITDKIVERTKKEMEGESLAELAETQNKAKSILIRAEAEASEALALGKARAEVERLKGEAEAEALQAKAEAYKEYGNAAVVQMVVDQLPNVAKVMAKPLEKTEKMVFVSGDGTGPSAYTEDVSKMVGHVPDIVRSLTGFNMRGAVNNLTVQSSEEHVL